MNIADIAKQLGNLGTFLTGMADFNKGYDAVWALLNAPLHAATWKGFFGAIVDSFDAAANPVQLTALLSN